MAYKDKTPGGGNRTGAQKYRQIYFSNCRTFSQDIVVAFKAALNKAGLSTKDELLADGKLNRFTVDGDRPGAKNGWYILFDSKIPAGAFGCWKRGISKRWCAKEKATLTATERAEYRQLMDAARKAREAEEQARRKATREKARLIWDAAPPASCDHLYLIRKGVRNHGLRLHKSALVVPLRDADGALHSLQFIDAEGGKRFLSGGRIAGCYHPIGNPTDKLCICEGYATGASIHEATDHAIAVAFTCGNLLAVAQTLRRKFSSIEIVICADNDTRTFDNPGLTKAREAAASVGALLAVPPCHGDFNDLLNGCAR